MQLDPGSIDDNLKSFEEYKQRRRADLADIEFKLAECTITEPTTQINQVRGVEMEKSRAPTFSGKTIEYPEFKRGRKKVAGVRWDDNNQVEQIKLKVDQVSRRIIS